MFKPWKKKRGANGNFVTCFAQGDEILMQLLHWDFLE
jgi:hypothetical protein